MENPKASESAGGTLYKGVIELRPCNCVSDGTYTETAGCPIHGHQ